MSQRRFSPRSLDGTITLLQQIHGNVSHFHPEGAAGDLFAHVTVKIVINSIKSAFFSRDVI